MLYVDYRDLEDENVIILDGSSIDSGLYSEALSPEVNEDTVLDLLHDKSNLLVPQDLQATLTQNPSGKKKRHRIGSLFRSLSGRHKPYQLPDLIANNDLANVFNNLDEQDSKQDTINKKLVSLNDDNSSFDDSPEILQTLPHSVEKLYDISKPMQFQSQAELAHRELFSEDHTEAGKVIEYNPCTSSDSQSSEREVKEEPQVSTLRSLGRKLSIFSSRSKEKSQSPTKPKPPLQISSKHKNVQNSKTDTSGSKINPKSLIADKVPHWTEHKNNDQIYLIQGDTTNNIDINDLCELGDDPQVINNINLLNYPLAKLGADKLHQRQTELESDKNNIFGESSTRSKDPKLKNGVDVIDSKFTVRSLNLQNRKPHYNKTLATKSCLKMSAMDLSQLNHVAGSHNLQKIQTKQTLLNLIQSWNIWVTVQVPNNAKKIKYQTIFRLDKKSQFKTLYDDSEGWFENLVIKENQQLFILKDRDIPIFHGKKVVKRLGEYVFIIPKNKESIIWKAIIFLLISGKFDLNSIGYEVRGICWRAFKHKTNSGYHLTFYVDDRDRFDESDLCIFLSELRLLIPENLKQYFKKCQTVYPNSKEVVLMDID